MNRQEHCRGANPSSFPKKNMNRQAMENETYRTKLQQYPPELSRPKLQRQHQLIVSSTEGEPKQAKEFDQTESVRGTDHKQR